MIGRISIENFKGVREPIELDLRPITLLFGPNSSGKSTLLHAVHYALEVLERHNLDPDHTIVGGQFVDLGGFASMVHGHDLSRRIRLGFSLESDDILSESLDQASEMELINEHLLIPENLNGFATSFGTSTEATINLEIAWNHLDGKPYVSRYVLEFDGRAFCEITAEPGGRRVALANLDVAHPAITPISEWDMITGEPGYEGPSLQELYDDPEESCLAICLREVDHYFSRIAAPATRSGQDAFQPILISGQSDALTKSGQRYQLAIRDDEDVDEDAKSESSQDLRLAYAVGRALSDLITAPLNVLRDRLSMLRYLGPLRETPARLHQAPKYSDPARWASGLGAWDVLQDGDADLIADVNHWLSDNARLNTGYSLLVREFKELELNDPLVIQLLTGRAFDVAMEEARIKLDELPTRSQLVIRPLGTELSLSPQDVGIGISQVVPVVVTALDEECHLLAIEQPELHLHPKLQAELGDLFIESAKGAPEHTVILETHSELIPLRIMRRIRETAEQSLPTHVPPVTSDDVAIYYVETHESATIVTRLELSKSGQLLDPWPEGFFEEGFRERFS